MPRRKRMYLPGCPCHIVQRGNNRDVCFVETENYQYYPELWCGSDACCLMTSHIHFLIAPEQQGSISRATSVTGSRYAYCFNKNINVRVQCGRAGINRVWFRVITISLPVVDI